MAGGAWGLGCGDGRHGRVRQTLVLLPVRVLLLYDLIPGCSFIFRGEAVWARCQRIGA